ncbi:hypothetical protein SAMN05660477_00012 [Soonwooa buanensis]|uniref:Uncharacterized protein n=1 Tax=Soonwooa buanensis TaxID=619805 RepID=A0A1T5CF17_9FLAO|nr:hypothetical protein [Soonwooa buanensis]SKB57931.1 hypothetical protein SAMN05660477_00012 [Soonwooa buanensis]
MNYLRTIILIISIFLFGWLISSNLNEIDFAKTKNDSNLREKIELIENSKNIEEIKKIAINEINFQKKNREAKSENAIAKNWIIFVLITLSILLFSLPKKKKI